MNISIGRSLAVSEYKNRMIVTISKKMLKGIFSNSNSTFLWHKSDDINKKNVISKISVILIFCLQVMIV